MCARATATSRGSPTSCKSRASPTRPARPSWKSAKPASTSEDLMADKRMREDDAVARLTDGMTIGIGGWASRRKPMSLVRAILRSPLRDLTVVSFGGPDVGMLCAAGKVKKLVYGFVSLDSIPLEPH